MSYRDALVKKHGSNPERALETKLKQVGITSFEKEVPFGGLSGKRKWRFDFAHQETKVAVEVQGGLMLKGSRSHGSPEGAAKDYEKLAQAEIAGWIVIPVTPGMVKNGDAVRLIRTALRVRRTT